METERSHLITDFEKREQKIMEFEENYVKNEKLLKELTEKCQNLEEKLKIYEEKSSQDEVIAAQLNELRSKIKQYETEIQELNETNARLRNALTNLQEENIKLEDELNSLKSDHTDINELKSKLKVLEETVITQQKEIVEKDKILKGKFIEEEGYKPESSLQKFIIGKIETIKEFNRLLNNVQFRIFLVVPKIDDLEQLNLPKDEKIDIRIATSFDLTNPAHQSLIKSFPNAEFRNYSGKDRWGLERDAEEICLVAESENKDFIGISSSDSKICELFSKLLTEAWLKGEKITP